MEQLNLQERVNRAFFQFNQTSPAYMNRLKKLLKESEKAGDLHCIGMINLRLSILFFDLGDRNHILSYAVKAADIFDNLNDQNYLAHSYNLIGLAYRAQGNYLRAIDYYNRSIKEIERVKKPAIRKDVMQNNIAECYFLMGVYHKSIRLLNDCLVTLRKIKPSDHINAVIYGINLSDNYESLEQYEKAIEILDIIAPDVKTLERDVLLWGYYGRRCCVLYKLGNLIEAEHYADLTIESINSGYDSYEFHRDFEKIAKLEVLAGDTNRAQCFADILTKYAEKNKNTIDLIISKRVQANICIARGENDQALSLYKELSTLYEKRVSEQNAIKYESQKKSEAASREIANLMLKMHVSEEKAERDPLSGLMNRSSLVTVTDQFYQDALRKGCMLGGIFVDIDFFKEYNDTYGHAAGDDAIRLIAAACLGEETETVKFFRYGGDEFFGIALDYSDQELDRLALRVYDKIRSSGTEHIKNPNGQRLTVSVGVANIDIKNNESTILDVIKYSDNALYHAKEYGKDVVFASYTSGDTGFEFRKLELE